MYIKFEQNEKYSKNREISNDLTVFDDAGYILTDNDLVIDIDCLPKDTIKALIREFDINTHTVWTDRGVHFYFKKPKGFRGAQAVTPLGFKIEYKHKGNTEAVTVKRNGVAREVDNDGIRQDLPNIFKKGKRYTELIGFEEGDGRNQELFKLRSKLGTFDNWQKILLFINNYIFSDPLPNSEMETLTRKLTISAEKDGEYEVASWLINIYNVHYAQGKLYFFIDDRFVSDDHIITRLIYDKVGRQRSTYVDEVKKQLIMRAKLVSETDNNGFDIRFRNGVLHDGEFTEVLTDDFTPYYIDIDYLKDAKPIALIDEYLEMLSNGDPKYRKLIEEVLGFCLITNTERKRALAKFFIFVGSGGNGKGTLLEIIQKILTKSNVTNISIEQLTEPVYLSSMAGKLANLGDDIEDSPINNKKMKILKNISTCDSIYSRSLYKDPVLLKLTSTLIFTSNHILKSWEKDESYRRRVMWLPMYNKPIKADPLFITKVTEDSALEYWIKLAIDGYKRLYKHGRFTVSDTVEEFNQNYHIENNPALLYLGELSDEELEGRRPKDVFEEMTSWANDNGLKVTYKGFLEAVYKKFKMQSVNKKQDGVVAKVFVKTEDTVQVAGYVRQGLSSTYID